MRNDTTPADTQADTTSEARIVRTLKEVLAPLVEVDGGRIEYVGRKGDVVEVSLHGACRGCPGQPMTLRGVILPALQSVAPEVRDVRAIAPPPAPLPAPVVPTKP